MCYCVYLSTDSGRNLALRRSGVLRFSVLKEEAAEPAAKLLEHRCRWTVSSWSGCGCGFRQLHSSAVELGFAEPCDWYPEDGANVEATEELYQVVSELLAAGHGVDLVNVWNGPTESLSVVDVPLRRITAGAFRLFENHRFRFEDDCSAGDRSRTAVTRSLPRDRWH